MFVKNKNSKDYTDTVVPVYNMIVSKYGNTARISELIEFIKYSYGVDEFLLFDSHDIGPDFDSYIMDTYIDWCRGKDINFSEVYESILKVAHFTSSEKLMFNSGNIEERLWAIYLAVYDPNLTIKINNVEEK